ncbi:hypothetical protein C6T62_17675 [Burkholderia multivorans]|nr:hypothetical protein C6T62_17675 [Burkholderia multivorans]
MYLDAGLLIIGWLFFAQLFMMRWQYPPAVVTIAGAVPRVVALVTTGYALLAPPMPGSVGAVLNTVLAAWWGLFAGGAVFRLVTHATIVMSQPPQALEAMIVRFSIEQTMISMGRQDLVTETSLHFGRLSPDEQRRCRQAARTELRNVRQEWSDRYEKERRERKGRPHA